jgi:hypothetical protein
MGLAVAVLLEKKRYRQKLAELETSLADEG